MALVLRRRHGVRALVLATVTALSTASVSLAHAQDVPPAPTPVAGARTAGDTLFPNVGNGGYDVRHYDLDIAWTPGAPVASGSSIVATATIDADTTHAPLEEFSLDFEGLTVTSVTVDGRPAPWERISDLPTTTHKLVVTPATPVDGRFTTVVTYSGTPQNHIDPDGSREGWFGTDDGATALNQPVGAMTWYPVNNTLKDKARYDIKLTIPRLMDGETMAAASNGVLHSKKRNGSTETWHWRQPKPMTPSLSMVSIGKFEVREQTIELESGTYRDWVFLDSALTTTQRNTSLTNLALTEPIMRWMESRFGPYPGVSTGAVVDRLTSGYALETQDRSFYPSSVSRNTLIHEIAHQWFGNAVTPADWSDLWLNEGAGDYMPRAYNNETGFSSTTPETTYFNSWNSSSPTAGQWRVPLAGFSDPSILYDYVYGRGGMSYENVRTAVGDEAFFTIMREWVQRNVGQNASTADYQALAEEISGKDLSPVFDTWVRGVGKPSWTPRWRLDIGVDPSNDVAVGDTVTHTLTATNTGRVALSGATATVDVSDLLDDATIDDLPDGVELDGSTLTWSVPTTATSGVSTVSFTSTVRPSSSGGGIVVTARPNGLGAGCGTCGSTIATEVQDDDWVAGISADPAPGAVAPGQAISYTVSVLNRATHALRGAETRIDLADVLDDATIGPLAGGLTLDDDATLTWTVPEIAGGETATVAFAVTVGDASDASLEVTDAELSAGGTGEISLVHTVGLQPVAPAGTPTIVGRGAVGSTLEATPGQWREGATISYQWQAGGKPIAGAVGPTYTVGPKDVGRRITVQATGTLAGRAPVTTTSAPTGVIVRGTMTARPRVFLTGTPKVGRTLRARSGASWDEGVTLTYRWSVGGKIVKSAKGPRYTVRKADRGKRVVVRVTASKSGYTSVTRTSNKTARVLR